MSDLAYYDRGMGEAVLFIAGRGNLGRVWHMHQVPAFLASGYRVITFDNRGVGETENASGFTIDDMVADTAALIAELDAAPVRIIATSLGAYIAQELMLTHPELVSQAALLGTVGRYDRILEFLADAEHERIAWGHTLPAKFDAAVRLLQNFSPKTLRDDNAVNEFIAMFTMTPTKPTSGFDCQIDAGFPRTSRLLDYEAITTPVLVIGFADDILCPAYFGAELADALPNGRYLQVEDTGHLGFLERPHVVNDAILSFFASCG